VRATCWMGRNRVDVIEVPDPVIMNERDAIVKITATAICGSDLHLYDGYIPTMEKGDVLGHEFMGEVVELGSRHHSQPERRGTGAASAAGASVGGDRPRRPSPGRNRRRRLSGQLRDQSRSVRISLAPRERTGNTTPHRARRLRQDVTHRGWTSSDIESAPAASGEVRPAERVDVEGDEATECEHHDGPPHGPTVEGAQAAVARITVDLTRRHRSKNPQLSGAQPDIDVCGRRAVDHGCDVPRDPLAKRLWRWLRRRVGQAMCEGRRSSTVLT